MQNIIQLKIPDELKIKFQKDKYLLPEHPDIEENISKIENYLKDDNVVEIIKLINSIHVKVEFDLQQYHDIPTKGFYQEFSNWLHFALKQLMNEINVDINHVLKTVDMYASLCYASEQLTLNKTDDINELISNAVSLVIEEKEGIDDNKQIRAMCSLFINIGKRKIIPEELADISYKNFLSEKNKENQTTIIDEVSNKIHQ